MAKLARGSCSPALRGGPPASRRPCGSNTRAAARRESAPRPTSPLVVLRSSCDERRARMKTSPSRGKADPEGPASSREGRPL
ncbi:hypothetical protein HMPREF0972_00259 [Actinomyces sp. oral taxon 848 str. F0332]|nr:hypothetical protein HMPREF0972_00259 [Actinomyces sp. oral taxon 848 str. F0332]